ncbi:MAG: TerD domain-containing protein [Methylococcaceae bacterium]|nr:TerD domain-containing protein [Methylococcaceae bacterium]
METIVQGQNTKLSSQVLTAQFASGLPSEISRKALDINAFMVGSNNKVGSDQDFVFFNQPNHPSGCLRIIPGALQYELNIARIPGNIEKIVLAITLDQAGGGGTSFKAATYVTLTVRGNQTDILFRMDTSGMAETSLILGEFYRRNADWKFKAVGQGFVGGLEPLAKHFGVDVDKSPSAEPAPAPPSQARPAAEPSKSVNLSKVTLTKRKPISLEKQSEGFGEMILNLNWNRKPSRGGGLLGGLLSGNQNIDLDLGAMVEYQTSEKIVIQALGNGFGDYHNAPWIQLMGDDRSGALAQGEIIKINGQYWNRFKRVLVFAFIYEGVPNWAKADAIITLKMPRQPELEVCLDSHDDKKTMCAVAMLDNIDNAIRITKLVDYYGDHRAIDQAFGFGFKWKAGRK